MHRIPGQITSRLPVDNRAAPGWKYQHEEWTDARAVDGYRLGSRWRTVRRVQRRRRRAALFQAAILALVCGGTALVLGIGDVMYPAVGSKTPPFCYQDRPAGGPPCYGVDRIGDLP